MRWGWRIEVLVGKAEGECARGRKYLPLFTLVRRISDLTKKETCITEARLHLASHTQDAHLPHAGTSLFTRLETSGYGLISDLCL
jgi:hypothetical protein